MPSEKHLYIFKTRLDRDVPLSVYTSWITDDYCECLRRLRTELSETADPSTITFTDAICEVHTFNPDTKDYHFDHYIYISPSQISADDFTCENRNDVASMLKNNLDSVQIRFRLRAKVLDLTIDHTIDRTIDRHVSTTFSIINERENNQCDVLCNDILAKDKLNPRFDIEDRLREGQLCHNAVNDAVNALLSNYTDLLVRDALSEIQRDFQNNADNP